MSQSHPVNGETHRGSIPEEVRTFVAVRELVPDLTGDLT